MMRSDRLYIGIIGISSIFFIFASSQSVDGRIFLADSLKNSTVLSTPQNISVNTTSNSVPSDISGTVLYQTARVFVGLSTGGDVDENIAPLSVYGSGTKLHSSMDPNTIINATWLFSIDPGFGYFVRYHFCNIIHSARKNFFFNVFLNSDFAARDLNLSFAGSPYYMDVFMKPNGNNQLSIRVGPSSILSGYPDAILNGLEIMKTSNSKGSLDPADAESQPSTSTSKFKVWMIVVLAIGVSLVYDAEFR